MSLAQIIEKIERDARAEAKKILDKAHEQEAEINRQTEGEVSKLDKAAKTRFLKERPEIFKRRDIVARLDINKMRLGAQRRLIQDVFDGAEERLKALDKDAYLSFCDKMLRRATTKAPEMLKISKNEKYIDKAWVDRFNAENGAQVELSEETQDFSSGFILSKGRIDINCSIEMLMQAAREKLETQVVQQLFPA